MVVARAGTACSCAEALFFRKAAVVTFGGAYAVLAYVAQQAVERYGWLQPGEMLDGLGMAETTPGPLIMVSQFVGFMGAFRDPAACSPLLAGAGRAAGHDLGHVRALLPVDLPRRAVHRSAARQPRSDVGALRDHGRRGGRDPQPRVWFALHTLFREVREIQVAGLSIDWPVAASIDLPALLLTSAAVIAVFRFGAGVLPVIGGCAAAASCCT